jgi:hypothetical protein
MMAKHTWNATKMSLPRKKSIHEKIDGPPNARGRNWDAKYGDTSSSIVYKKIVDTRTTCTTYNNHHLERIPSSVSEFTQEEKGPVAIMEEIIQLFLDLLQVTGGELAP